MKAISLFLLFVIFFAGFVAADALFVGYLGSEDSTVSISAGVQDSYVETVPFYPERCVIISRILPFGIFSLEEDIFCDFLKLL
jgi:hypothetical protein